MGARFTPYPAAARAEAVAASYEDRLDIGREIADTAQSIAPVLSGDYRDGIGVESDGSRVFVVDVDENSIFKEYGTVDTPPHAVLTQTAAAHGEYSGWQPR